MKIAVFGFYNALNAGDDRLQAAVTHLIGGRPHHIVFLPHDAPPDKRILRDFDWILIGGGGLVFQREGLWKDIKRSFGRLKSKIGVLGLGVNHLPDGLRPELKYLLDRAEFFFVRDRRSHELLGDETRVGVAPDLAWTLPLDPPPKDSIRERFRFAVNLAPCPWKAFDAEKWIAQLPRSECIPFPLYVTQRQDLGLLTRFFDDVPPEFSLLPLLSSGGLVGARYHSIVFSMQLAKPFVAIAYDHKVRELCREAGLEHLCLETDESDRLPEALKMLEDDRDAIVAQIREFAREQIARGERLKADVRQAMGL